MTPPRTRAEATRLYAAYYTDPHAPLWAGETMIEPTLPLTAYVAGPYRDPRGPWYVQANIRRAEAVALELWRMSFAALCPHKNTALFDGAAPDDVWLLGDLSLLAGCDLLVAMEGYRQSEGARAEVEFAASRNIPVYLWPMDREKLETLAAERRAA